jgi:ABC-type histidine transport system ATPase subunit
MPNLNNSAVVRVEDLHKQYGNLEALRGITFEIKPSEFKLDLDELRLY